MKSSTPTFRTLLQRFFTQRLMQQKRVSAHTINSYRDTFRLLLRFAQKRLRTSPPTGWSSKNSTRRSSLPS